jgi:poly-gamma-glutamate synthesis protein (capsule biosynthesis protein)
VTRGRSRRFRVLRVAGSGVAGLAAALALSLAAQEKLETPPVPTVPVADGFTIAGAGDLIYLRPMLATIEARSPDLLRLLRGADVTFGNFETSVIDLAETQAVPQAESGGTWMHADPGVPADVRAMGFTIVSHANNHATDWGVEGMAETGRALTAAKLVWAGTGKTMAAARAPRYLDTAKGRVAIVAATSTFTPMSVAADPVGSVPGRPGVNSLRTRRSAIVSSAAIDALADLAARSPLRSDGRKADGVTLMGSHYMPGTAGEGKLAFSYRPNQRDVDQNLMSVRQAKQNGNFVIFSVHNHEPSNASQEPAGFAIKLAHDVIDAGADVYMGHGPHQLRGIEIYKGRPIFYSLGNFAMMNNSLDEIPDDMFQQYGVEPGAATVPELLQARNARSFSDPNLYESVIATSRYDGGQVVEIRLYPIDLGVDAQGAGKGVPAMASPARGQTILERLQRLSAPFGTTIVIERGIGIIRVGEGGSGRR